MQRGDDIAAAEDDAVTTSPPRVSPALLVCVIAAFIVGMVWRVPGASRIFWFDETFTGAIALQPSVAGLIHDCLHELSGPVYYGFIWAWAKLFGASDVSLRLPSLLFSIATPLLLALRGHPDRTVRLVWGALAAVLFMLVYYTHEARAYSLLFLFGALQAIAFGAFVRRPRAAPAYAWATVSALMALTHYFTLAVTALQALALLVLVGRPLLRFWPAALLALPVLGWMSVHLPTLIGFSAPGVAWQPLFRLDTIGPTIGAVFGGGTWIRRGFALFFLIIAATFVRDGVRAKRRSTPSPYAAADIAIILSSAGAIALIILYGVLRPSFTPRYLTSFIPGLLLAPAIWSRRMARVHAAIPALLVAGFTLFATALTVNAFRHPEQSERTSLEWERAATAFMAVPIRHLAFFWDDQLAITAAPETAARLGGFFFDRAGSGIRTTPVILAGRRDDPDPNLVLPALLDATRRGRERDAFFWLYMPTSRGRSVAERHPPRLSELSKRFRCRDYIGEGDFVGLGCVRLPERPGALSRAAPRASADDRP